MVLRCAPAPHPLSWHWRGSRRTAGGPPARGAPRRPPARAARFHLATARDCATCRAPDGHGAPWRWPYWKDCWQIWLCCCMPATAVLYVNHNTVIAFSMSVSLLNAEHYWCSLPIGNDAVAFSAFAVIWWPRDMGIIIHMATWVVCLLGMSSQAMHALKVFLADYEIMIFFFHSTRSDPYF